MSKGTAKETLIERAEALVKQQYENSYSDNGCYSYSIVDSKKSDNSDHVACIVSKTIETYRPGRDEDFSLVVIVSPDKTTSRFAYIKSMDSGSNPDFSWYKKECDYKKIKSFSSEGGGFKVIVLCADDKKRTV